jgi:polyhydroxybutyrate depolymerase
MPKNAIELLICIGVIFLLLQIPERQKAAHKELQEQQFKKYDKDGDGEISNDEVDAANQALNPQRQQNEAAPAPQRMTWTIAGEEREALVYLPGVKTEAGSPVVFGFHGHGGNMRNADRTFGFQKLWPEAVVVYMQGLPTPGQLTDPEGKRNGWQHDAEQKGGRDLKFFDAVLKTLREKHPIDENRIYASGHSNGGGFTYLLWANRPDVFAAIAPSAAGSRSLRTTTPKPIPVMHLAGREDQLVKFSWQKLTMQQVRKINGCQTEGQEWAKDCTLYPSETEAPFVCYIHNGTHKYPAEGPALIVKFFKEHKKPMKQATN